MNDATTPKVFFALAITILGLSGPGCATHNVNPPQPRANTGYVDFHAASPGELDWDVSRFDDRTQKFQRVFSELKPPAGGILRLAFAPGHHRLRVTFLNCVVLEPVEVDVEVVEGRITPVEVRLADAGTVFVETREYSRGATVKGRYGRRIEIGSDESAGYRLSAVAHPPVVYQPKEQMPYAR